MLGEKALPDVLTNPTKRRDSPYVGMKSQEVDVMEGADGGSVEAFSDNRQTRLIRQSEEDAIG